VAVYNQLQVVKSVLAPDLSDRELQLFAMVCQAGHWDPFAKEIYAVKRKGRVTFQTGIDGYRSKAEDTHEYDHSDEPVYAPADWDDGKPGAHPATATVKVYRWRNGHLVSQSATARWDSYYPGDDQGFQWRKMPDVMLAKCAEALAFRKLFPRTFEGVYVDAEMDQATASEASLERAAAVVALPTARERTAARAAAAKPLAPVTSESGQPATADGVIEGEATDAGPALFEDEPVHVPTMEELKDAADTAGIDFRALAARVTPDLVNANPRRNSTEAERLALADAIQKG
jgi:phage recombination protein Bet